MACPILGCRHYDLPAGDIVLELSDFLPLPSRRRPFSPASEIVDVLASSSRVQPDTGG
jgi:hypothetical protein